MRSQLPNALLAWRQSQGVLPDAVAGPVRILDRRGSVPSTTLLAAGELMADKLPMTPGRLEAGPFLGRLFLGATAGVSIASAFGHSRFAGGLLGIAGAAAGSVLGFRYREYLAEHTDTPDGVWAVIEDAFAITLGLAATRGETS